MNTLEFLVNGVSEEAGEIVQVCSKINRFGLDSVKPGDPDQKTTRTRLIEELNDIRAIALLLKEYLEEEGRGGFEGFDSPEFIAKRQEKFLYFAKISKELGRLTPEEPVVPAPTVVTPDPTTGL